MSKTFISAIAACLIAGACTQETPTPAAHEEVYFDVLSWMTQLGATLTPPGG